jgi:hypothetical protein
MIKGRLYRKINIDFKVGVHHALQARIRLAIFILMIILPLFVLQ